VILVTLGTNEQPFDRLVLAAAALEVDEPVIVQYGSSRVMEPREGWVEYMPYDELAELAGEASAVVCHAGVGSILMARRAGKKAIVMARRGSLNEAVDDHQVGLAKRLSASNLVTLVDDAEELRVAVIGASSAPTGHDLPGANALALDLRAHLARIAA
jgi:UDP-N-acetylglucosamine transferase subunit ALG13